METVAELGPVPWIVAGFLAGASASYIISTTVKAIDLIGQRLRTKRMKERAARQQWEDASAWRVDTPDEFDWGIEPRKPGPALHGYAPQN